ncbi:MAG TPA: ABC transporter substrate-binding protein [Rhodocyclaceae bacterium]|nr:ABC transporter substrate-binding protein [Rhodocyclaceae bacterium]
MLSLRHGLICCLAVLLAACGSEWNNPYPAEERLANTLYTAFTERPKHLDPVQSYAEDEATFLGQVYEPPLQYHYLKRPYTLVPGTVTQVPQAQYFDAQGKPLPAHAPAERIAYTDYVIELRPGIRFQPHPAFALRADGSHRYHDLKPADLAGISGLRDFAETGSRELIAADYVYNIKRLAHPQLHSPIFGLMSGYIVGLGDYGKLLKQAAAGQPAGTWLDLRQYDIPGVEVLDRYRYRIRIKGKYPQFLYWLAMNFFAPMPWEADRFHSQPGMLERNLVLDWYPVGTGPYMLTENNPNARMVLERNPNYHGDAYPCEGEAGDREAGLLADCGKPLPFIDKVVFTREKEQIPYWNKFLQGYYDASGISSDSFDQAVQVGGGGDINLTEEMQARGIRLITSVAISDMFMGFNMLDPLIGAGGSDPEAARKIRQAISIALDQEEFISIFTNGRGVAAQGPIPPGIFGHRPEPEGINPYMYRNVDGRAERRSIADAKKLLAEAGYPNGRNAKTGAPLIVNLDTTGGGVGSKARTDWLVKQFHKIDVQLVVRSTDWNRFQEKVRKGASQIFYFGWNADYPDPENFLFLFYGPQSRVKHNGENAANYANPEYDRLFEQMRSMENTPERQRIIDRMVEILRRDAPWVWGFHPKDYTLGHAWLYNRKPSKVGHNTLKYQRLDPALRAEQRAAWNAPVLWPLGLLLLALAVAVAPAVMAWRKRERRTG